MIKRKVVILIYIIVILVTLKMLTNLAINSNLILKYNNGEYLEKQAQKLKISNIFESYIAYYNYGNILYQNGKFDEAIEEYKKALKKHIPKMKECNIRINYALAICKTVQVDENSQESIKKAIKQYEEAIDILTEDNCAHKDDNNGHSEKAEKLKQDIQKEIDRLKKLLKEENNEKEDEEDNNKPNEEDESEKQVEEQIQQIKEEAIKDQREMETTFDNYNKEYVINEKNW